jgi:hypothetical protein
MAQAAGFNTISGMKSELANLRHVRLYTHKQLDRYEPLVARLRAKLAETEAAIQALAPELPLSHRRHAPNPIFARGEMSRMALDVLRQAREPLPIRVIAVRMLAAKGIALPDPAMRGYLRKRLRIAFAAMDRRGVTVRIGEGHGAKRALAGGF